MLLAAILASATGVHAAAGEASLRCDATRGPTCAVTVDVAQIFAVAAQLTSQGKADDAIELLKVVTRDPNPDYRAEARVRIARLLIANGDLWGAARWYQQLLDEKPEASAARIELAQLLARLGNEAAAARQLRLAEAAGLPDVVSQSLRQARDFLKSRKPFGVNVAIGFAPDTNVNTATTADSVNIAGLLFKLDDAGKARSGIGLTYSVNAVHRLQVKPDMRWISQIGSNGNIYRQGRFNDITAAFESGPEIVWGKATLRPALLLGHRNYQSRTLYNYYGLSLAATVPAGKKAQVSLGLSRIQLDYAPIYAYQSGPTASARIGYDRALSSRLIAHVALTRAKNDARDKSYALASLGGEFSLRRDFKGVSIFTGLSASRLRAEAPFPLFSITRRDRFYQAELGLVLRRISWHGLSPQVRLIHTRNDSTIALFRYRRLRAELSLTGSF